MRMVKLLRRAARNSNDYIVIAGEAKQSIAQQAERWIASSRSLSSGAHSGDPLAPRNDGKEKAGIAPGLFYFRRHARHRVGAARRPMTGSGASSKP
jgi:hypothetical protein